jgi:hypothetical protein
MKKNILLLIVFIMLIICGCAQNEEIRSKSEENTDNLMASDADELSKKEVSKPITVSVEGDIYKVGETVEVVSENKKIGTITIDSVYEMEYSNSYSEKHPEQILIVEYTYKNTGRSDGMFISSSHLDIIDKKGEIAQTYPAELERYPQDIKKGQSCTADQAYGLNNVSKKVTIGYKSNIQSADYDFFFTADIGAVSDDLTVSEE